jgi:N,N'-diacetylbacillosaminyl-diphospho-undecaprenol alpha-1,3-N-acetylgalactosaminyltransferase
MKVALVSPDDLSSALFCKEVVSLLKNRYKFDVFVLGDIYDKTGCYSDIIRAWGVHYVPIKVERYIEPFADLQFFYSMCRFFRTQGIAAVITNCTKPNVYGPLAARWAGIRNILCSFWGRGSVFVDTDHLSSKAIRGILLGLYSLSFKASSKVWFTNFNDYQYLLRHGIVQKEKSILSKNYVNTDEYNTKPLPTERLQALRQELALRDTDKVVIMVGRLVWAKGVREFVEAARLLKDRLPFVKFIFVGPKEEGLRDVVPESYLRENAKLGNFLWTGFRKDVKDLYALADLAVLPSYYKEGGFPRGLTEPMSMGKPIIAADTVDCRGPVEDGKNGYLVPIKDPKSLADSIETIMRDNKKKKEFGLYSRLKAVKELDEKVIVAKVLEEFVAGFRMI